jgi:serine/threonine protein kinase
MNQERWRQIERLCLDALDRESGERNAFLDAACPDDPDLRREVESLIAQESAARNFLEGPTAEKDARVALAPGTRLGPYEVTALIGVGGMGDVYSARDARLERTVAIKVLPPAFAADPERRARLEGEARTIARLNHPHICTLHDVGDHAGSMFLVMEHVAGESLAERLRKGPLPLARAVAAATEIADALAAAHRQGVIHRDLKPANVMVTPEGHARSSTSAWRSTWAPDPIRRPRPRRPALRRRSRASRRKATWSGRRRTSRPSRWKGSPWTRVRTSSASERCCTSC